MAKNLGDEEAFNNAKIKHIAFQTNPSRGAYGDILGAEGFLGPGQLTQLLEENETFAANHDPESEIWKILLSDEDSRQILNVAGGGRRRRKSKKRKSKKRKSKKKKTRRRRTRRR